MPSVKPSDTVANAVAVQTTGGGVVQAEVDKKDDGIEGNVLDSLAKVGTGDAAVICSRLEGVIEGVLKGKMTADARGRIAKTFAMVISGRTWGDAIGETGASWAMIHAWGRACKPYKDLLDAVRTAGEAALHSKRIQAAHRRAIDGVIEPVYQGGEHVGDICRYSDRLLELLLKGGDPARYNPAASASPAGGQGSTGPVAIQININTGKAADCADKSATVTVADAT